MANENTSGNLDPEALRAARRAMRPSMPKRIERHIQGRIVGGLLELAPLIVTALVIAFLIGYADAIRGLPIIEGQPWDFPGIGLIILIVVAYVIGLMNITAPGRMLIRIYQAVMTSIPVIRTVFGVTRQAVTSFSGQFNFSRVVFLEWPRDGMVALGFVTGQVTSTDGETTLVAVYIPTVPNPTSGNMAFVMEDDLMETNLSVDEAMKLVFSGGIVLPSSIVMARISLGPRSSDDYLGLYHKDATAATNDEGEK